MRPTREQAKEILRVVKLYSSLGVVHGVRLSDGTKWGSCRHDEVPAWLRKVSDECAPLQAKASWWGQGPLPRAPKSTDWNPRTRKWSWER